LQVEKELWLKIGRDDQQAYAEAYRFYYKRFYNYGRKFSNDEPLIEDAVQEALLSIWDKRATLTSIEYPATYFYTSFRYLLFEKLKQKRRTSSGEIVADEPEFSIEHFIVARETDKAVKEQLQIALTSLTPRQREAIFLRFYEGLSYENVASVLHITTKATYKIMARALSQLRENMVLPSITLTVIKHLLCRQ
jgi:RNA polymerase sigma factor (sigma-70 family)